MESKQMYNITETLVVTNPHFYVYPKVTSWEVAVRGYVTFVITVLSVVTNGVFCFVFVFRGKRTSTAILLTSLAVSNAMIVLILLPVETFYFNILGNYQQAYMPYHWCKAYIITYYAYQTCRMVSNWLTTLLGFQRCIAVCIPAKYKTICKERITKISIIIIILVAILLNIIDGLQNDLKEIPNNLNHAAPSGCTSMLNQSVFFYAFIGLVYRIIPVIGLTASTIILVIYLKKHTSKDTFEKKAKTELRRISKIVVVILIVFVITESQDGIAFFIYAYQISTQEWIIPIESDIKWITVSQTMSLIGYACNFWIFFMMSKQFRSALLDIIRTRRSKSLINFDDNDRSSSTKNKNTENQMILTEISALNSNTVRTS